MQFSQQERDALQNSLEWEQKEEETQYKAVTLKQMFPANYLTMRNQFFAEKQKINPHFVYNTVVYPEPLKINRQYEAIAIKILQNATPYPSNIPLLTQDQVKQKIQAYLDNLGLKDYVQVQFVFQCLSRTSVAFLSNKIRLKIRTPLTYTQYNLEGVLNHQVGTHIIRTLNHRQNCQRKPTEKGKIIEEGLAAINQLLPQNQPFLFKPALRYMAAIWASQMDFVNLYGKIKKYVKDPEECWRQCVRVKRGISNTEQPGGFYKDQNYLIGAVNILRDRDNIDFQKLFYGKLNPSETKNLTNGVLPPFLGTPQKLKVYKKKLDTIALVNFIDQIQSQN